MQTSFNPLCSTFCKQEEKDPVTHQLLTNKAYCFRSNHIRKSKTVPGIKCHYNYLTSEITPLLLLEGFGSSKGNNNNETITDLHYTAKHAFNSKYLDNECLGPTTNEVQKATDKQRQRKVRDMYLHYCLSPKSLYIMKMLIYIDVIFLVRKDKTKAVSNC